MASRGRWAGIAAALLLLTGCHASEETAVQEALTFRTALLSAKSCGYTAEVTADLGERIYEFTMDCTYRPSDGAAELTVTEPETIAGISAAVDAESAAVSFDDLALDLGEPAGGRAAPLQLPRLLGEAWSTGYVESQAEDGDGWQVTYRIGYDAEELLVYTWLDAALSPTRAEVYEDGVLVLSAELSGFEIS